MDPKTLIIMELVKTGLLFTERWMTLAQRAEKEGVVIPELKDFREKLEKLRRLPDLE
jgi:hypothetical protein